MIRAARTRLSRRILGSGPAQAILAALAAAYIRLVFRTSRWDWRGFEAADRLIAARRPFIVCFWHNRLLLMPCALRPGARYAMLISDHRDGRLIARAIGHFGARTVVGSSTRGGAKAAKDCLELLAGGTVLGITPDGPRGPRLQAAPGAVRLARLAGVPLLPAAYAVTRRRTLRSWDRFLLALPFSRGVFLLGAPIEVAATAGIDAARRLLEDRLNALSAEADRLTGHAPAAPAPAPRQAQGAGR